MEDNVHECVSGDADALPTGLTFIETRREILDAVACNRPIEFEDHAIEAILLGRAYSSKIRGIAGFMHSLERLGGPGTKHANVLRLRSYRQGSAQQNQSAKD